MTKLGMTKDEITSNARDITEEFRAQGLDLTLRQLYYQFVARGLLGSGQAVYKRIGDILTEARYNGEFPADWIVDRGRDVQHGAFTRYASIGSNTLDEAAGLVRGIPGLLINADRWHGQPNHVSVWFEKEALAGVFGPVCDELGVGWFACKGYPSVSALYQWVEQTARALSGRAWSKRYSLGSLDSAYTEHHEGLAERAVILYAGDHDPDGWEIPRSAYRGIRKLQETYDLNFPVVLKRIALNMDQITQYNPPPFDAKESSSRFIAYREEHNTVDAWELDALEPTVMRDLIRAEVGGYFNPAIRQGGVDGVDRFRADIVEKMSNPEWLATVWKEKP
jgi:hypothetical protein